MNDKWDIDDVKIGKELEWSLRYSYYEPGPPIRDVLPICVEPHRNKDFRIADGVADWWKKNSIASRVKQLEERGSLVDYDWQCHNKGLRYTAGLLVRADDEETPFIWLAAFLFDVVNHLPRKWRGSPAKLLRAVRNVVFEQASFDWWHHAMRNVLPVFIANRFAPPEDVSDLCKMAWITAAVCQRDYQLVRVSNRLAQVESIKESQQAGDGL